MKFYVRDMVNKVYSIPEESKRWVKFGQTHHTDADNRFNPEIDDGYEKNYEDWDGKTAFSWPNLSHAQADIFEQFFLVDLFPATRPEKVWVEKYLGCEDNNRYDNCSGITELRLLSERQRKWVLQNLYALKDNKPVHEKFQPLKEKLENAK